MEKAYHIINLVSKRNPAPAYVAGYLAAYLVYLMDKDPYVYKEFLRHLSKQDKSNN